MAPPVLNPGAAPEMQALIEAQCDAMRQAISENSNLMMELLTQRLQDCVNNITQENNQTINGDGEVTKPVKPPLSSKMVSPDLPGTLPDSNAPDEGDAITLEDSDKPPPPKKTLSRSNTAMLASGNVARKRRKSLKDAEKEVEKARNNGQKQVFADANQMKEKIRQAVNKKAYNVHDYYHETGFCSMVAKNVYFDNITLGVILANALWISIDTDLNDADLLLQAEPPFIVAENLFCLYFTFEWAMRFGAFRRKLDGLGDFWFVFDSIMCFMMVFETWLLTAMIYFTAGDSSGTPFDPSVLKLFRLMRLTRMARMARLFRAMPELMILIKGMAVAMRSVVFTLILLGIIMYIFAIVFRSTTRDTDTGEEFFESVMGSMLNLLLHGILPDQSYMVYFCINDQSTSVINRALSGVLVLMFILLGSLTVMNMLVGVLVEVVGVVSNVEKESLIVNFVKAQLQQLLVSELEDEDHEHISRESFQALLMNKKAAIVLEEVGVDVVGLVDFQEHIFKSSESVSFAQFMEVVLQLRGTNIATVRDIVDLRKFVQEQLVPVRTQMNTGATMMAAVSKQLKDQSAAVAALPAPAALPAISNGGPTAPSAGPTVRATTSHSTRGDRHGHSRSHEERAHRRRVATSDMSMGQQGVGSWSQSLFATEEPRANGYQPTELRYDEHGFDPLRIQSSHSQRYGGGPGDFEPYNRHDLPRAQTAHSGHLSHSRRLDERFESRAMHTSHGQKYLPPPTRSRSRMLNGMESEIDGRGVIDFSGGSSPSSQMKAARSVSPNSPNRNPALPTFPRQWATEGPRHARPSPPSPKTEANGLGGGYGDGGHRAPSPSRRERPDRFELEGDPKNTSMYSATSAVSTSATSAVQDDFFARSLDR